MPLIKGKNLHKEYILEEVKIKALNGASLSIERGEFVAIIGPSGSGKSTIMHVLGLLDSPSSGEVLIEDRDVSNLAEKELARLRSENIGFVFQSFNLLPRTTTVDNVIVPILYSRNKKKARDRAIKMLKMVGLGERLHNTSSQLSGGQQQRVAIARALINDPKIIFADEPTGNLDSKSGIEIMSILDKLNKEGKTIILVTHENNIAKHARRIIKMMDGRIISDTQK